MEKFKIDLYNIYKKYSRQYATNNQLANQKRVLGTIYVIFTLIMISTLTLFAIQPALVTIAGLKEQLAQNKKVEQEIHTKLQSLSSLDLEYQGLTPNLPNIFLAIPKSPQIPYLTREIEVLAKDSKVTLSNLSYNAVELYPAQNKAPLFSFTFSLTAAGSQETLSEFLGKLIAIDRIISISRIGSGKSGTKGEYETTIVAKAYYYNK